MCKAWLQKSDYARDIEFSEVKAQNSSKETVDNFFQAVKWRPCLFHSIDLSGAKTAWSTFCEIVQNCTGVTVLNMAKVLELNLRKTKLQ